MAKYHFIREGNGQREGKKIRGKLWQKTVKDRGNDCEEAKRWWKGAKEQESLARQLSMTAGASGQGGTEQEKKRDWMKITSWTPSPCCLFVFFSLFPRLQIDQAALELEPLYKLIKKEPRWGMLTVFFF